MATAYLNIPNDVDFDLAAMFGMIQSYLSVPGYTKTNGGLKQSLMKKVKNGKSTFDRAWKGLYATGHLKRTRFPLQSNRFYDYYQLLSSAAPDLPCVRNMTHLQGKSFMTLSPAHYEPSTENYTGVSRAVLEDPSLKLVDKNLYILIRKLQFIQARNQDVILSKDYIRYKSGLNVFKFNHAWKRLKEAGYLVLERSYDHVNKHTVFLFSLPMENKIERKEKEPALAVTKKRKTIYQINREQIHAVLEEKAEGDLLREWGNGDRTDAYYTSTDVDKILIQLTDLLCSDRRYYRISGTSIPAQDLQRIICEYISPDILHRVLNTLIEKPPTKNAKLYMVALVYNECTTPTN